MCTYGAHISTIVGCIFYLVFYKSYIYILLQKTEQVHISNLLILNSIPFAAAQLHRVAYLLRILNTFSYFGYSVRSALPLSLPRILILFLPLVYDEGLMVSCFQTIYFSILQFLWN